MPSTFAITGATATRSVAGTTLKVGDTLDLTLATAQTVDSVTLAGGVVPTLVLSNGATAAYTGVDTAGLHFRYTVAAGQDATNLALTSLSLNGASVVHVGTASFSTRVTYATGIGPIGVTAADVNGDGRADLLVANNGSSTVSVLLGNGDGTFRTKTDYTTGFGVRAVAVADVNGDGKADLVAVNEINANVSVLLGNGNGTFQAKTDYSTSFGTSAVTTADVNGDGKADIVTANAGDNKVSVLLGNGNGTFQVKTDYATGNSPRSVVTADVNGDGRADLVISNQSSNTVSVLLGNGNGTFGAKQDFATGVTPFSVATADVNGDGKADLVTANSQASTVSVLLGNGDGTFQAKRDYSTGAASYPITVSIVDINGDGKLDLMTANTNATTVSVLLGNGDGTFQAKTSHTMGDIPVSAAAADFNGDGAPDIVTVDYGGPTVSVVLNTSVAGSRLDPTSLTTATGRATGLSIDTTVPTVASLATAAASPTNATGLTYTLAFSEAVTGVDASDFGVTTVSGTAAGHVASVVGSGAAYTIVLDQVAGDGKLRLDLKGSGTGIADAAGNVAAGYTGGAGVTLDHTAPLVRIVTFPGGGILNGADALDPIAVGGTSSAEDGQLVTLAIRDTTGTTTYATATAAITSGAWSLSLPAGTGTQLPDRSYRVTADVSDRAGNAAATAQRTLLVDKFADQPPFATLVVDDTGDRLVNAAEAGAVAFTVAGLDPFVGASVQFTDGTHSRTVQVLENGSGTVDLTGFDGRVKSELAINDIYGNTASATGNIITLRTRAPAAPTLALANDTGASASDRVTSDPALVAMPSAPGDTLLYALDGGGYAAAVPTFATDGSTDGQHTVSVMQRDTAGNLSAAASLTFTLETSVPVVPVVPIPPTVPVTPTPPATIAPAISGVSGATNLVGGHVVSGSLDPAQAGLAVTIRDGATVLGIVTSDSEGRFALAVTDTDPGFDRAYGFTASVTDTSGHTDTSATFDYALDFTPNLNLFGAVTHDAASAGGQVYALYDGLLGRAPDVLGFSYWTDQVAHGESLHDVAAAMLALGEFTAGNGGGAFTSGTDGAFVQHLYAVGLGRAADAGGAAYWDGQLAAGMSRVDVALSLALSSENAGQIAPALGAGVFVPDATAGAVARLYDAAFGREPDAAGLVYWTGAANAGVALDAIMSGFLASAEGLAAHPAGESDTAFVQSVYAGALGRPADAGGLDYWNGLLAIGVGRATVATGIAEGAEAQIHLAGHVEAGWHLA